MNRMPTAAGADRVSVPAQPSSDELAAFMYLGTQEITRLVLCLLIEERLQEQLDAFRSAPQHLPPEPF